MFASEEELDEFQSRPTPQDIQAAARLDGDLMVLGASGKMGPTLVRRALRACQEAGIRRRIFAVARSGTFPQGVEVLRANLLDQRDVVALPQAENVLYLVGRKFGSTGNEPLTWATNAVAPVSVARHFTGSRIVVLSTGNVYPFVPVDSGGATEQTPPAPVGEYAMSAFARERIFSYFAQECGLKAAIIRLNYAIETRYGVLVDIAQKVMDRVPVDVSMGYVNVIWQGDANAVCLRSLELCESPVRILNLTGPETISVREIANKFGLLFQTEPIITGAEAPTALLNNAAECWKRFGMPAVGVDQMMDWIAAWLKQGLPRHGKPTHFEVRSGKF
jgi:nucleoside-diphosphate-sugar epimerase